MKINSPLSFFLYKHFIVYVVLQIILIGTFVLISDSRDANCWINALWNINLKNLKEPERSWRAVFTPLALFCLGDLKQTGGAHLQDENPKRAICAAKKPNKTGNQREQEPDRTGVWSTYTFFAQCNSKNRNLRKSCDAAVNYECSIQYVQK